MKINSNKDHEYMNMITGKFELIKDTIEIDSMSYKILKL